MRGCRCHGLVLCDQCQRLAERAGVLAPPAAPVISEKAFQQAVVRLAKQHQWLVHFAHDSRKSPAGYPDLTLARLPGKGHPGQLVIAELKVDAPLTIAQEVWLATLSHVSQTRTFLWKPENMEQIRQLLA